MCVCVCVSVNYLKVSLKVPNSFRAELVQNIKNDSFLVLIPLLRVSHDSTIIRRVFYYEDDL